MELAHQGDYLFDDVAQRAEAFDVLASASRDDGLSAARKASGPESLAVVALAG